MRVVLLWMCAGCLAAPPDPDPTGTEDDGMVEPCVPGSQLDLAYVSEVGVAPDVSGEVEVSGLALVINPGADTIAIGEMDVSPTFDDHGVSAEVTLEGSAGMRLDPLEAKGALGIDAAAVVLGKVSEEWTDLGSPLLAATFVLPSMPIGPGGATVRFAISFGDYEFPLAIRVVEGPVARAAASLTPRAAQRISAVCP